MKPLGKAFFYVLLLGALLCPTLLTAQLLQRLHKPLGWPPKAQQSFRQLPHYQDGEFLNPVATNNSIDLKESLTLLKGSMFGAVEKKPNRNYRFTEQALPDADTTQLQLNWLGHATVLIKSGDTYLLTDPVLNGRASPFSFTGPKRFFPSPISAENLPELEAVIISHDHYDHLSYETLKAIQHKVKRFFVPLGVGTSLRYWGIPDEKIIEMDWWQDFAGEGFRITAAPARHFSGRLFKRNNTLWASWAIELGRHKIYFGGDSGYFEGYEEIGQRLGPFDVSFMPIGAYNPAWAEIHLNPAEAVKAHGEVQGGVMLPIHWGTFDLAPHSWYDPLERLLPEIEKMGIPLLSPQPGQWVSPLSKTNPRWWQEFKLGL